MYLVAFDAVNLLRIDDVASVDAHKAFGQTLLQAFEGVPALHLISAAMPYYIVVCGFNIENFRLLQKEYLFVNTLHLTQKPGRSYAVDMDALRHASGHADDDLIGAPLEPLDPLEPLGSLDSL